ncbi:MAG: marine proteobacterial sortase target protein [Desulfocapsaceae bacterium]|nr:marine proteobacterial sortase target protein [Desulfocapsaceae bacterium]
MKKRAERKKCNSTNTFSSDPGNILMAAYLAAVVFFLLLGSFSQASAQTKVAEDTAAQESIQLKDVDSGQLLISREQGKGYVAVPLLEQDVDINVSGMLMNAQVRQRFQNTSTEWIEAVYVFPLPDESGVTRMRMIVGDRVIVSEVKEKHEARAVYERAREEGKKSSLLAQKRPNIFTTAVANIPPQSIVEIEIEYLDAVHYQDNIFSLRFPMVVGPRYIPGKPHLEQEKRIAFDEGGWAMNTDEVEDGSQITPPVVEPGEQLRNPVELSLSLSPGFPVKNLSSLYHGIAIEQQDDRNYAISFDGRVFADRDFVLEYEAANEQTVSASLFSESIENEHYNYLMLMPPQQQIDNKVPREVIFVVDISGSMAGSSMRQAKEALVYAISRLRERDRFNIIVFSNKARKLYPYSLPAQGEYLENGLEAINGLQASGGTEIAAALDVALDGRTDHRRIRQIVFLTDGAVGNEKKLLTTISKRRGDARLFTIGIGSAPNTYFMTRAATVGRGSYTFIGKVNEVQKKMTALFDKLENPVVTGLKLDSDDNAAIEMYPQPFPDLYHGEPFVALLKSTKPLVDLRLSGTYLGKEWSVGVDGRGGKTRPGIAAVWARKKIRSLMESLHTGASEVEVRREVLKTALKHHLVSRYTSLVAVEDKISRPQDRTVQNKQLKTNLPSGWQHDKVFGTSAQTATNSQLLLFIGCILLVLGTLLILRQRRLS